MRIEIKNWMVDCYGLSGLELLIYALIYSETELSTKKIATILNMDVEEVREILDKLRKEGYLIYNLIHREDYISLREAFDVSEDKGKLFTWTVNEDLLL